MENTNRTTIEFPAKIQHVVYEFWNGDVCLYIGRSSKGMQRCFSAAESGHLNRNKAFREATRTLITPCESTIESAEVEAEKITQLTPKYNQVHMPRHAVAESKYTVFENKIRASYATTGVSQRELAAHYDLSLGTINSIVSGVEKPDTKRWR